MRPVPPLVLASRSPRRRELLRRVGLTFRTASVSVDENLRPRESGRAAARRLARAKALAAAARWPGCDVLAADTLVLVDGSVLGKPAGREEARRMLRALSGRWHRVVTGVTLLTAEGHLHEGLACSRVRFARLTRAEIDGYTATAEPYDKAGAYAIQGAAAWFVAEVRGSVSNVIGLPLEVVRDLFRSARRPPPPFRSTSRR
ncbi:MAG: septum formation protein Maf [Acidobacteria bacterium]|nr:MAG: septum formation protein Maf [Acidobacteriota bacterium]